MNPTKKIFGFLGPIREILSRDNFSVYGTFPHSATKYSAVDCIQWVRHSRMLHCVLNKN